MAALSADATVQSRPRGQNSYVVTTSTVHYVGALVCVDRSTGKSVVPADTANFRFKGICTKAATGDGTVEVPVDEGGRILERVSVASVSSIADVGDKVYLVNDNPATLTHVATSNIGAIGYIVRWHTSTTCDVQLFSAAEFEAMEATAVAA